MERKIYDDLFTLKNISNITNQHAQKLAEFNKEIISSFIAIIIIIVLTIGGACLWLGYIKSQINIASSKLNNLDFKLSYTPVIKRYQEGDYVRVVPNTDVKIRYKNNKIVEAYAKVWHDKR